MRDAIGDVDGLLHRTHECDAILLARILLFSNGVHELTRSFGVAVCITLVLECSRLLAVDRFHDVVDIFSDEVHFRCLFVEKYIAEALRSNV